MCVCGYGCAEQKNLLLQIGRHRLERQVNHTWAGECNAEVDIRGGQVVAKPLSAGVLVKGVLFAKRWGAELRLLELKILFNNI